MVEFRMPKLGESIAEATVISWLKNVGDYIAAEETLLEVATDKVDSEVPSPVSGIIKEIRFQKNDVVPVGTVMALIEASEGESQLQSQSQSQSQTQQSAQVAEPSSPYASAAPSSVAQLRQGGTTFLSPLIISIAQKENLSIEELQLIPGSGADGRLQKSDVYQYLKNRKYPVQSKPVVQSPSTSSYPKPKINFTEGKDYIIEMDRMRKMIADHMVYSKQTSPHVTSYLEVDVTDLVAWRNNHKEAFQAKTGQKLTFTPLFVEAVAKAIQAYPLINVAVEDTKIYVRKDINIGMATALPTGNLIVPVVRNADTKDLAALASDVNQLAESARTNTLKPEQIQGSTFTISNVGTFGSLMGTPIINQPEVAILAFGIIKKRPEVITTAKGDEIAIRSMMFLSLSFDHRVVDGFLGGSFLRKVGDYLEQFDTNTTY
ncbi:dihydrolipoamide acetyltransferase family protein [Flavobacterium sp. N1719]|uniref:dihydrolipoamide acetyltransferase family protein n=1 Tax=Flavobacterium sp. N1719 TaxID=2885633 RepID=UPI002221E301|nr:dihydrolipoamide acetyltransferase family protein [Flavobacterium sp. N1719]